MEFKETLEKIANYIFPGNSESQQLLRKNCSWKIGYFYAGWRWGNWRWNDQIDYWKNEIEKKFNSFNVHIKKSILLKDGKYGSATYASKELIEEMYPELPDLEKRIIDILTSLIFGILSLVFYPFIILLIKISNKPNSINFLIRSAKKTISQFKWI